MNKSTPVNPEKDIEKVAEPKEHAQEADRESREIREVVEGTEVAEFIEGEVSEAAGEGKKKIGTGIPVQKAVTTDETDITALSFPKLEVMRIQIATRIEKEIVELEKEASQIIRSPGKFDPFRLNRVVARIRYLRDFLSELAYATTEKLKMLWQKYVKGGSSF
ncbi:hypothetical protein KJ835_04265 [Patescibacteria group bacterium]|nr:hypothetical protein [Patescibacteria group bacterium]